MLSGLFFGGKPAVKTPLATSASFLKTDTTTLGSWKSVYGSEGYYLSNDSSSPVTYGTVKPPATAAYTWASSSSDLRALQKASAPMDRMAAC